MIELNQVFCFSFQVLDYAQYYLDLKTANKEVSSESDMSDTHTIIKQKSDIYSKSHRFDEGNYATQRWF